MTAQQFFNLIILFLLWEVVGLLSFAIAWNLEYIKSVRRKVLWYVVMGPLGLVILILHNWNDVFELPSKLFDKFDSVTGTTSRTSVRYKRPDDEYLHINHED